MKAKRILHKTIYALAGWLLALFCVVSPLVQVAANAASSSAIVTDFSATDILDDLSDIDIMQYPKNEDGELQVIRCQEYCFSGKPFFSEYYGIYLYVYNPTETPLQTDGQNTINMAVEYGEDGKPSVWEKMPLTFCDRTDDHRFYKFEIADYTKLLPIATAYAEAHDGTRRYDFADIEFVSADGKDVDGFVYSKTYYFSGFGAGCSDESKTESTLTCEVEGLETIELQIEHTNYRTENYNIVDSCDEINTAYFSVENRYFEAYGGLQKIKAEWYEYKTNPIFVTSDEDAYTALEEYIGVDIGEKSDDLGYRVLWRDKSLDASNFAYGYNNGAGYGVNVDIDISRFDWLFERTGVESRDDYYITAEEVEDYMETYTKEYGGTILNGYSANLFAETVDEGRTRGYNVQEIDAGEKGSLFFAQEQSWWNKMWNGLKFDEIEFSPIITFSEEDFPTLQNMSGAEFGEKYFVNEKERESVRQYCLEKLEKGEHPVLFRFAVTDYTASSARFDDVSAMTGRSPEDGYVAKMTQFLDFDVISLTFRNERGVDTVIAVCADPIDIINGVSPPSDLNPSGNMDWEYFLTKVWEAFLQVVGVVAVVIVVIILVKLLIAIGKKIFGDNDG